MVVSVSKKQQITTIVIFECGAYQRTEMRQYGAYYKIKMNHRSLLRVWANLDCAISSLSAIIINLYFNLVLPKTSTYILKRKSIF